MNTYNENEDVFWSKAVPKRVSWFKVAPPKVALEFSIERRPKDLFEMNNFQLPFGCHAWEKYEPEFWVKHIK